MELVIPAGSGVCTEEILGALRGWKDALLAQRLAATTLRTYLSDVTRFLTWARPKRLADVTTAVLRRWLARDPSLAAGTVRRQMASLRNFFRWCLEDGVLVVDPAARLRSIRAPKPAPRPLSVAQVRRLLAEVDGSDTWEARDHALVIFLYASGCRISEARDLEIGDLDLAGRTARVTGKRRKTRHVLLAPAAVTSLRRWLAARGPALADLGVESERVFVTRTGRPLDPPSWTALLKRHMARAGLPAWAANHTLRHSMATHLMESGVDLRVIQELLGHASLATTQIYLHASVEHLRASYDKADLLG